ncbi:unnamed protein product [Arctia plantaginis]|uniref:Neurotransmitter-gated ion-channel ligand-binding domain-containing protein n=1 Tax=Arctia plantaginis TaxID=874455 RepID=A0A8S1B642_ARCPL|nr:unnamed protein product [Arctia plantaginis]
MATLTYILLLGLQQLVLGFECKRDVLEELTIEKQLLHDLLKCGYANYDPPKGPNAEKTVVTVKFILKYFNLYSTEEVLNLYAWRLMSWNDDRLKWDPASYGDLEEIELKSGGVWTPTFKIFNSANGDDIDKFYVLSCTLKHTGAVSCGPRSSHLLYCDIKLSDFPYDAQTCNFVYGVLDPNDSYNVSFPPRAMGMSGAEYGSSWFISDYKQEVQKVPDTRLNITLVIEREAESLAAIIVYPALIVSSLSIACLFLDARLNERLMFTCFSIFSNCYWLRELVANLPKLREDPPRILLYYRASLVITMFILILTLILSVMCRKETPPHNIVILMNKFVYGSYVRFLVYPRWEFPDDGKFNEDWTKFANSINSLCIKVIVFSYIGLYVAFVPQPIPFN